MITYFIINKLGTVIYQSTYTKKHHSSNTTTANESQRIRYLPLLVIKDLIKANLNDVVQYIKIGNKTVAFREQQNLLYIACTKRRNVSISLLQQHLRVMHSFIKFHYGPHWSLHIQGSSNSNNHNRNNSMKSLSSSDLNACLSLLPFLCGRLSMRSCDSLCLGEQVQVSDDLRCRLMENMVSCCNSAFVHQYTNQHHHHHRNSFFSSGTASSSRTTNRPSSIFDYHHSQDSSTLSTITTTWNYCYLFAREKLVTQCHNGSDIENNDLPDEFIYFLKLLVSQFMQEKHESGNFYLNNVRTTTLPQNISNSPSSMDTTAIASSSTTAKTLNNTTTAASPTSTKSETSASHTTNSSSQPSSLAYVYDANSSSAPFKIREKSASSVTVVSSDSSISYWSNPLTNSSNIQAHSMAAPMKAMEIDRIPANVLQPQHHNHQLQQSMIADILNVDDHTNTMSFLSSSVPSESTTATSNTTATTYSQQRNPFQRVSSAPSSPTHRSRSQSLSTTAGGEDSSLKHLLTNLINGETSYLDQTEDVKLVRRWVKLDGHIYLANFLLILISDGLCAVVVCKDDPDKHSNTNTKMPPTNTKSTWKPTSLQVKRFKASLKSCLSDFTTFLLTKEATHFTNLSFAVTYPGLVHFIHFDKGIMTAPCLVDLNDLDKNHELLHEVYGTYNAAITDRCKWVWPNELTLKKLCNEIIHLGLCYRQDPHKSRALQESNDHEYYFLYQRTKHQELLAIYFSIIPSNRLWTMHQKLFNDISQRVQI
ncbi:unnamed protein product [Mucor circinelloides]